MDQVTGRMIQCLISIRGKRFLSSPKCSDLCWGAPNLIVCGYYVFALRSKVAGHEVDHSLTDFCDYTVVFHHWCGKSHLSLLSDVRHVPDPNHFCILPLGVNCFVIPDTSFLNASWRAVFDFDAKYCLKMSTCSAHNFFMFTPAQLSCSCCEQWVRNEDSLRASVVGS